MTSAHPAPAESGFPDTSTRDLPVLTYFRAAWCRPCRQMDPIIAELSREYQGRAHVLTIDLEAHPEAARTHHIVAIPTFTVSLGTTETGRISGARPKQVLRSLLDDVLAPNPT